MMREVDKDPEVRMSNCNQFQSSIYKMNRHHSKQEKLSTLNSWSVYYFSIKLFQIVSELYCQDIHFSFSGAVVH